MYMVCAMESNVGRRFQGLHNAFLKNKSALKSTGESTAFKRH